MSGSPKYTSFTMDYSHEAALAAERARLAAIEQAARAAEAERLRQQRLAKSKTTVTKSVSSLQASISSLTTGELGAYASGATDLANRLATMASEVAASNDESEVARLRTDATRVRAELSRLAGTARAAKLAADLSEEAADAARIDAILGSLDRALADRFDLAGAEACRALLAELNRAIDGEDLGTARGLSPKAQQAVDGHVSTVHSRHEDWQGRRDRALLALGEATDRVAAAQADEVCIRWVGADLEALAGRLTPLAATAESDQPESVLGHCQEALAAVDELDARAQQLQLSEERRQAMVTGLISVMDRMSFTLQQGSPANDDESDPASAVRIRVRRGADRSTIAIGIGIDGDVSYEIDGFARRLERGTDGEPAPTCDEAEEQIEAFHRVLEKEFGVKSDDLRWLGKNPTRILRTAKHLPASAPSRRTV